MWKCGKYFFFNNNSPLPDIFSTIDTLFKIYLLPNSLLLILVERIYIRKTQATVPVKKSAGAVVS